MVRRAPLVQLLLFLLHVPAAGCGGVSPNAHVLDRLDREARAGTVRMDIESTGHPVAIERGTDAIEQGDQSVCWTPCTVHVPPGPLVLRAHDERFQITAERPGMRAVVAPPSEGLEILAYVVGLTGASAAFLSLLLLPSVDFDRERLGSTEIGFVALSVGGLALWGLGVAIGFGLSGPSVDAERVSARSR